ncbi:hypothetical protein HPB47_001342 [Ixodes persulcatus]|uniref:Uncharacterized protein n=1 Tax=Ixodes persulcatus TaxID=34615 RepID=A0AC60PQU1_IXOPE|nr:hypothetical protein HPB47_001342 [Ixodes persulcatus]
MAGLPNLLAKTPNIQYELYADDITIWTSKGSDGQIQDNLQEALGYQSSDIPEHTIKVGPAPPAITARIRSSMPEGERPEYVLSNDYTETTHVKPVLKKATATEESATTTSTATLEPPERATATTARPATNRAARDAATTARVVAAAAEYRPDSSAATKGASEDPAQVAAPPPPNGSVETRKKVVEGSILNSPSGARETSNGRWYYRWPEEVGLE